MSNRMILCLHLLITAFWLIAAIVIWVCIGPREITPSSIGDYVSGVFSPLAFYWLIVGYFLQRRELELQRKELQLNREQWVAQVLETRRMADAGHTALQRDQLHDRVQALPQHVYGLVVAFKPFPRIGPRQSDNSYPVTFISEVPSKSDEKEIREFADRIIAIAKKWNHNHLEKYGTITECLRHRDNNATDKLQEQFYALTSWWEDSKNLSRLTGLQELLSKGTLYGVETLLEGTALCLGINRGEVNATVGAVQVNASGTLGTKP